MIFQPFHCKIGNSNRNRDTHCRTVDLSVEDLVEAEVRISKAKAEQPLVVSNINRRPVWKNPVGF